MTQIIILRRNIWSQSYISIKKTVFKYCARRLIGSWIIESAAYCNQIMLIIS